MLLKRISKSEKEHFSQHDKNSELLEQNVKKYVFQDCGLSFRARGLIF